MLIFLSFAGPPASCVHCGRNFSRNETELFIKPERSGTAFRLQVLSRQDLFLSAQRCSGLDEPGGRGCPLRTAEMLRPAPFKRSFSCLKEKKLPSCNRTKAVSRFYHLLQHTQAHRPFICVPLTRELTSALTLYVFQGLQLGSDLR